MTAHFPARQECRAHGHRPGSAAQFGDPGLKPKHGLADVVRSAASQACFPRLICQTRATLLIGSSAPDDSTLASTSTELHNSASRPGIHARATCECLVTHRSLFVRGLSPNIAPRGSEIDGYLPADLPAEGGQAGLCVIVFEMLLATKA